MVAREYGLPTVMSVSGTTKHIQDGQTITVDGNKDIVYIGAEIVGILIGCYLLGSIPEAWLITKWVTGQDLRQLGSGNLGVANTAVSVARWAGLLVFLIEAAKGMLTVVLVRAVGGSEILVAAGVLATVSGTRWSIWLKGAGGRGNTVGLAALLLMAWPILLASLMVLIVIHLIITHNSFFGHAYRPALVASHLFRGDSYLVVCAIRRSFKPDLFAGPAPRYG